ncbi:MAG TPA: phosphotransferase, partial [Kofleriaceae bacterium]|nr:phosphotransferase [Kofleriaceae bacterium]
ELAAIADPAIRARAPEITAALDSARYQTLLHGDAKEANFCFAENEREADRGVAAVDFQYAGRGCGIKDVAYLLWDRADHVAQLDVYFRHLRARGVDAALEAEWRALYPLARADFARFLAGWRPG